MANTRLIKNRIKSAKNIAKITKAMEMVSASKMRRAQEQVQASRPYASKLDAILRTIAQYAKSATHPLLEDHPTGQPALLLVSTDRGLCGALNTNLFKAALDFYNRHPDMVLITVGKKAHEFAMRVGIPEKATFLELPERVSFTDTLPMSQLIQEGFLGDDFSSVTVIHMEFISTLSQAVHEAPLLPLQVQLSGTHKEVTEEGETVERDYVFEPNADRMLGELLPYYLETELYQLLLDARASEHSARMISMQNASNNAKDVVDSLQLEYNKGRQASITQELLEITTASLSITG